MAQSHNPPALPADLEAIFSSHESDPAALIKAFMPALCDHVNADRIFIQPRVPSTRICKILRWRRSEDIPWPANPGQVPDHSPNGWFQEPKWEIEDPLWRAALQLQPSIYIEDLQRAAAQGLLNLDFETKYMFHTAFIHGHAHWPALPPPGSPEADDDHDRVAAEPRRRQFYGSVQPAVFDGPRVWSEAVRDLMERCLERIAPVMKAYAETAPGLESFEQGEP